MIYKYLDTRGISALFTQTLLAKVVTEFNDPFEFDVIHKYGELLQHEIKDEKYDTPLPGLTASLLLTQPMDLRKQAIEYSKELHSDFRKDYVVLCFSRKPKNILMWSHYAESHKGLVLGFDEKTFYKHYNLGSGHFEKVKYHNTKVTVDSSKFSPESISEDMGLLMSALSTKSTDWKYEAEVRSYLPSGLFTIYSKNTYSVKFNPESLKEIYFGAKMTDDNQNMIIDYCYSLNKSPRIKRLRLSETKFELIETEFRI